MILLNAGSPIFFNVIYVYILQTTRIEGSLQRVGG